MPSDAGILIVDDHRDTRYALESALAPWATGCAVSPAVTRPSRRCCAAGSGWSCSMCACPT